MKVFKNILNKIYNNKNKTIQKKFKSYNKVHIF